MIPAEIKTQIFKTPDQWQSGLSIRLNMPESGGITLYPMPAFAGWPLEGIGDTLPCCLTVDPCSQVYFIDKHTQLYCYNPANRYLELIPCIGGSGAEPGKFNNPTAMAMNKRNLWVLDSGNKRIQVFARENYQVRHIIKPLENPVDIALGEDGCLYVLHKTADRHVQILTYNAAGERVSTLPLEEDAAGLEVTPQGGLYVIERKPAALHKFTVTGEHSLLIKNFSTISENFEATHLTVDKTGNIYIVNAETGILHLFDPELNHIGAIAIPGFSGTIEDIATDASGNLYAATNEGLAFFSTRLTPTDLTGIYYSKVLDSGIHKCQWHRLGLQASIPENSRVEIYYCSFDDEKIKKEIDNHFSNPELSTTEKIAAVKKISVEKKIAWIGPETNPPDMLFREKTGRYIRLKIVLSTFEKTVKPGITGMKLYYPRITYMQYLPALYREDKAGSEFLERYLSLFQTVLDGIEEQIDEVPVFFDPAASPSEFLPWLSTWLGTLYDETWEEESWRIFLSRAYELYKKKGTRIGLLEVLEIYTGHKPYIIENFQLPAGCGQTGPESTAPAGEDILYAPALEAVVRFKECAGDEEKEEPLRVILYGKNLCCFCVLFKPGAMKGKSLTTVKGIIEEWKSAHTGYGLVVLQPWIYLDTHTYIGVNTYLSDPRFILDDQSALGRNTEIGSREKAGQVGIKARVGIDLSLT